jgi:TatD DNase family protein
VRFVDSHLHLDSPAAPGEVSLAEATDTLLLACGVDRKTSDLAISYASSHGLVKPFVGVHPSEALKERGLKWFDSSVVKAAGIGEIGLDPKYSSVGPRSAQRKAFTLQLEVAQAQSKPVQVHSRGAEKLCLQFLGEFNLGSVLMHWFEDEERLVEVVGRGYFVSFGPALLYSKRLQRMAARCDPSRILTETDSPVPYSPLGGVRGPSLIPSVVFRLSEVLKMPFDETRELTVRNGLAFLGPGEKG